MKTRRDANGLWIVALERGEALRQAIEDFAARNGIHGARISAVGASEDPELAYYDLGERRYHTKTFRGIFEVISADGNITLKDGKPFMHMHSAMSGHDYQVFGGHVMDFHVGVVLEVFIDPLAAPLERRMCDDVGLPTWAPYEADTRQIRGGSKH